MQLDTARIELADHVCNALRDRRMIRAVAGDEFLDNGPHGRGRQLSVGDPHAVSVGDNESQWKDDAWYRDNAAGTTHPVSQKRANAWGLYDMHGNDFCWAVLTTRYCSNSARIDLDTCEIISFFGIRPGCQVNNNLYPANGVLNVKHSMLPAKPAAAKSAKTTNLT